MKKKILLISKKGKKIQLANFFDFNRIKKFNFPLFSCFLLKNPFEFALKIFPPNETIFSDLNVREKLIKCVKKYNKY